MSQVLIQAPRSSVTRENLVNVSDIKGGNKDHLRLTLLGISDIFEGLRQKKARNVNAWTCIC